MKKNIYVFEADTDYGGGLIFQSATTKQKALDLAKSRLNGRFELTLIGTINQFKDKIFKQDYYDYTYEE